MMPSPQEYRGGVTIHVVSITDPAAHVGGLPVRYNRKDRVPSTDQNPSLLCALLPTQAFADLHQSVQLKSILGFRISFLQREQIRMGSSFQNSISFWHMGHTTSKISSGFQ
jgi:hypothetical protein